MKGLETGREKIQKICDALRKETLEPARQEAGEVVENAHLQADEIIREANEKARSLVETAEKEIEQKRRQFQSSLQIACRQGIEQLKQKIEHELFHKQLAELIVKESADPKLIVKLIEAFIHAVEEKGFEEDVSVIVPKTVSARSINALLIKEILERLKEKSVVIGDFGGGVKILLRDSRITIDMSDAVIREILATYIRRDFRDLIFQV